MAKPLHQVLEDIKTVSKYLINKEQTPHQKVVVDKLVESAINALSPTYSINVRFAAAQLLNDISVFHIDSNQAFLDVLNSENTTITETDKTVAAVSLGARDIFTRSSLERLVAICGEKNRRSLKVIQMFARVPTNLHLDFVDILEKYIDSPIPEFRNLSIKLIGEISQTRSQAKLEPFSDDWYSRIVPKLLKRLWTDWNKVVQDSSSLTLSILGKGRPMITWIVNVLQKGHSQDKIEALKMLARLRILTRKILDAFLLTLRDFHVTVRLEACKTCCVLASNHPAIINSLIELADDFVPKIRAYAMKALGVSGCKAENVVLCIKWALEHDPNPTVRIQGCEAVANLNLPLAPLNSETDDALDLLSSAAAGRKSIPSLVQAPSDKQGLLGVGNLQKEVHFLGRTSVAIMPLDARFESELSQNMSILMHGLALHDPNPSVRSAAEQSLRRINAYRVELNLANRYQETNSNDPHFFTNEATVIREVKELTTKEAVTSYIMST